IPALLVTAIEMKLYGEAYARQISLNAKKLAEALASRGFKVLGEHLGYTQSHQVLLDVRKEGGGNKVAKLLQEANIITNKNLLPYDPPDAIKDPSGLRLGVQEMTRFGMKEEEMDIIASFFEDLLIKNKDPEEVAVRVKEFRSNFIEVKYSLDSRIEHKYRSVLDLLQ
nr:serine hydroxymethyltransferase [Desulfurococcales archaeon]